MKFSKQFSAYIQAQQEDRSLSYVEFKRLKHLLKHCRLFHSYRACTSASISDCDHATNDFSSGHSLCPPQCAVCDRTFFPLLMQEVAVVLGCFNSQAQRLLQIHLASGFQKLLLHLRSKLPWSHLEMVHEGEKLVSYIHMNALAIQKILKKYDKVHLSKKGRTFKSRFLSMHGDLLQSPWLVELIAFHLNLEDIVPPPLIDKSLRCFCDLNCTKPTISCLFSKSVTVEIDLTCCICLEMVFDPVSLRCGHIFCNMCACSAASILTVEGLKAADKTAKCPLCRQAGVYERAVQLTELGTLLSTRCNLYWKERLRKERVERLAQAKQHWDRQCRAALGL